MGVRKKPLIKKVPDVNISLKGFNISINTFGEIQSSCDIDKINAFLDSSTQDPKLSNTHRTQDEEEK